MSAPLISAPEVERVVLASMIADGAALRTALGLLAPTSFYVSAHRVLFETLADMTQSEQPIDAVTLADHLDRTGHMEQIGGVGTIAELIEATGSTQNVEHHARILQDRALRRAIAAEYTTLTTDAANTDQPIEALLGRLETLTGRIADECERSGTTYQRRGRLVTMAELRPRFLRRWQQGEQAHGYDPGWSGLATLYRPALGTLNIVTGMPGHGKSEWVDALAVNMAVNHGWRWAMFSPENYPTEIHTQKLAEKHAGESLYATGAYRGMAAERVNAEADWIAEHFEWVEPSEDNLTLDAVLALFRSAIAERGIQAAVIDPWNELEATIRPGENETTWIGRSLNRCRRFARRHEIALYIVAHPAKMQRNKQGQYDVPRLYDISGSAHWYNKADNGLTVFRHFIKGEHIHLVDVHVQKIKFKAHGHVGSQRFRYIPESGQYDECDTPEVAQKRNREKRVEAYQERMSWEQN